MVVLRFSFVVIGCCMLIVSLNAEVRTEITATALAGYLIEDSSWTVAGTASGLLSFLSPSNAIVKARLDINIILYGNTHNEGAFQLAVPRAFIMTRFPVSEEYTFRMTIGKNRISWGEGIVYNAGDLFNGARADIALESAVLRDESLWYTNFFFPIGDFAFLEAVLLLPQIERGFMVSFASDSAQTAPTEVLISYGVPSLDDIAAGFRLQSKNFGLKWELGYLYMPTPPDQYFHTGPHLSYLSLQWHLGVDWYTSLAFHIPNQVSTSFDTIDLSAGLLYLQPIGATVELTFRVESLVRIHEKEVYLFPEILASFGKSWSVVLRNEWRWQPELNDSSWLDLQVSALMSAGFQFSHFQGFSLDCFFLLGLEGAHVVSFSTSIGMSYIF